MRYGSAMIWCMLLWAGSTACDQAGPNGDPISTDGEPLLATSQTGPPTRNIFEVTGDFAQAYWNEWDGPPNGVGSTFFYCGVNASRDYSGPEQRTWLWYSCYSWTQVDYSPYYVTNWQESGYGGIPNEDFVGSGTGIFG